MSIRFLHYGFRLSSFLFLNEIKYDLACPSNLAPTLARPGRVALPTMRPCSRLCAVVPYRRRSSDPQSMRERAEFRRDRMYGRDRPLPDAPWRASSRKSYLDDAERLYGRKETWCLADGTANLGLKAKQIGILRDHLRDTLSAARLEVRTAARYQQLCNHEAAAYRQRVALASTAPAALVEWARSYLDQDQPPTSKSKGEGAFGGSVASLSAPRAAAPDQDPDASAEAVESRRQRGAEAELEGTPALDGEDDRDLGATRGVSAFPFLRRRAVEDGQSLDPSLLDWTLKCFPEDQPEHFTDPPQLRQKPETAGETDATPSPSATPRAAWRRPHPRERLSRSLRAHEDASRPTFDAEGVFYHLQAPGSTSKPRPVRGSDGFARNVVKVPWEVVTRARQPGHTPDILRAKERLVRLTRGEDPDSSTPKCASSYPWHAALARLSAQGGPLVFSLLAATLLQPLTPRLPLSPSAPMISRSSSALAQVSGCCVLRCCLTTFSADNQRGLLAPCGPLITCCQSPTPTWTVSVAACPAAVEFYTRQLRLAAPQEEELLLGGGAELPAELPPRPLAPAAAASKYPCYLPRGLVLLAQLHDIPPASAALPPRAEVVLISRAAWGAAAHPLNAAEYTAWRKSYAVLTSAMRRMRARAAAGQALHEVDAAPCSPSSCPARALEDPDAIPMQLGAPTAIILITRQKENVSHVCYRVASFLLDYRPAKIFSISTASRVLRRSLGKHTITMLRASMLCRRLAPTALLMNTGKVVSWMNGRGFGFIEDDADKKQHFVHFSALQTETGGFRALTVGQEVEFEVATQDGRTRAENVTSPGGDKLPSGPRPPEGAGRGFGGRGGRGRGRGGRDNYNNNENNNLGDEF
eukprot:gene8334-5841_t